MGMESEWMRSIMTVITFCTFVAIAAWAWSARKRGDFDRAARSILSDDDHAQCKSDFTNDNKGQSL